GTHAVHPDHPQPQDDGNRGPVVRRDDGGARRVEIDQRSIELNEDRAARYHRLRRRSTVASTVVGVGWLGFLFFSGVSGTLAWRTTTLASSLVWPLRPVAAILLVAGVVAAGWELLSFPFVFYRSFLLDRKYGLSSEAFTCWLADHLKALALGLVVTFG